MSWTELIAEDESGNTAVFVKTHAPGDFFGVGSTTVLYIFADDSNNMASCTFTVEVNQYVQGGCLSRLKNFKRTCGYYE